MKNSLYEIEIGDEVVFEWYNYRLNNEIKYPLIITGADDNVLFIRESRFSKEHGYMVNFNEVRLSNSPFADKIRVMTERDIEEFIVERRKIIEEIESLNLYNLPLHKLREIHKEIKFVLKN
ncbi:hypothetical protein [Paenibacillus medicaginis]|uniref:Uncharacterized protein n=1 Tax=Paenibacillus medicaginis TaxID=1470560 RepID=A0ABV5BUL8_9BACL